MKKIFFILFLIIIPYPIFSQSFKKYTKNQLTIGGTARMNLSSPDIFNFSSSNYNFSYAVGGTINFSLSDISSLTTSLMVQNTELDYSNSKLNQKNLINIRLSLLQTSFYLGYQLNIFEDNIYISIGPYANFLLEQSLKENDVFIETKRIYKEIEYGLSFVANFKIIENGYLNLQFFQAGEDIFKLTDYTNPIIIQRIHFGFTYIIFQHK